MKRMVGVGVVAAAVVAAMVARPQAGQSNGGTAAPAARAARAATAKPYVPPRTPWGDPDIQGGWTNVNENGIPMEKPNNLARSRSTTSRMPSWPI